MYRIRVHNEDTGVTFTVYRDDAEGVGDLLSGLLRANPARRITVSRQVST